MCGLAEFHYAEWDWVSVIILRVVILSFIMLSGFKLIFLKLSGVMLSVIRLTVVVPVNCTLTFLLGLNYNSFYIVYLAAISWRVCPL